MLAGAELPVIGARPEVATKKFWTPTRADPGHRSGCVRGHTTGADNRLAGRRKPDDAAGRTYGAAPGGLARAGPRRGGRPGRTPAFARHLRAGRVRRLDARRPAPGELPASAGRPAWHAGLRRRRRHARRHPGAVRAVRRRGAGGRWGGRHQPGPASRGPRRGRRGRPAAGHRAAAPARGHGGRRSVHLFPALAAQAHGPPRRGALRPHDAQTDAGPGSARTTAWSRRLPGGDRPAPGEYPSLLDQLAVHLRFDRAGGELDDVDGGLAG